MQRHIKTLGILYIVYGGLIVLAVPHVVGVWWLLGHPTGHLQNPFHFIGVSSFDIFGGLLSPLWQFYTFYAPFLLGVLAIIGGWGLYCKKNWGRILVLIIAIICLVKFPLGTALGIYTLWVLLKPESTRLMTS